MTEVLRNHRPPTPFEQRMEAAHTQTAPDDPDEFAAILMLRAAIISRGVKLPDAEERTANRILCEEPKLGNLSAADLAFKDPDSDIPKEQRPKNRYEVACQWFCPLAGSAACRLSGMTCDRESVRQTCVTNLYL